MATITLKNIPEDLYEKLKTAAKQHHRSINGETIYCLERVLCEDRMSLEEELREIDALRNSIKVQALSPEEIKAAIESGRA